MPIKFGTDGWRAQIAQDYTFENVRICAQGTADFMKEAGLGSNGIIVGYDTRFGSASFAKTVAEVTTGNGITTILCDRAAPTPVVSYNLVSQGVGAGVVITASHNPSDWNGYKFKPIYGGSASTEIIQALESRIENVESNRIVKFMSLGKARSEGLLECLNPEPAYLNHIASLTDINRIRNAGLNIAVDSMHGAGAGYFSKLLGGGTTKIVEVRKDHNPSFPGMLQPEPIAGNIDPLISAVITTSSDVGLATDGDADRLGVVDEDGNFVTTLQIFALLCFHLLGILNMKGPIVKSITMTSMIEHLGEIYDVPVLTTPVGFKHLGPVMTAENALAAGEESGGYAFRDNIPERDGILSGLMLLDMMVKTDQNPSELLSRLFAKVGPHHFKRLDLAFNPTDRASILRRVSSWKPNKLGNVKVQSIDTTDGFRFVLDGGWWTLIRFSGTEPLLRIYAEADSPRLVQDLIREARLAVEL